VSNKATSKIQIVTRT